MRNATLLAVLLAFVGCTPQSKPINKVLVFSTEISETESVMISFSNLDGPYNFQRTDTLIPEDRKIGSNGPITEKAFRELVDAVDSIEDFSSNVPDGAALLDLQTNYLVSTMNGLEGEPKVYLLPKDEASEELKSWVKKLLDLSTAK